ncbi:MAG: hypothetical protein ABDH29_03465 [Aquificaceae bacterium]
MVKREEFYRKNIGRELRATVLEGKKLLTENYIQLEKEIEGARAGSIVRIKL